MLQETALRLAGTGRRRRPSWSATRPPLPGRRAAAADRHRARAPSCSSPSAATPRPPSRWPRTRLCKVARRRQDATRAAGAARGPRHPRCCRLPEGRARWRCRRREQGKLVTFGIVPSAPETGYGYIRRGEGDSGGAACIASPASSRSPTSSARAQFVDVRRLLLEQRHVHVPARAATCRSSSSFAPDIAAGVRAAPSRQRESDLDFTRSTPRRSQPAPAIRSTTR